MAIRLFLYQRFLFFFNNLSGKGNLQILGNIGSWHHQTSADERKNLKKSISGEQENYLKPNYTAGTL